MISSRDALAPEDLRALLPIAQRFNKAAHRRGHENVVSYVEAFCVEWNHDRQTHDAWETRRLEYGRAHRLGPENADSPTMEFFELDDGDANDPRCYCEFPDELRLRNEPKIRRPIPIPEDDEPTISGKFAALAALRDELVGGCRFTPSSNRYLYAALCYDVRGLTADDAHRLELWCEDVEQEFASSASIPSHAPADIADLEGPKQEAQPREIQRLFAQLQPPQVTLDGTPHAVNPDGALMVQKLLEANGDWTTGAKIGLDRADRVRKNLPKPVQELIETATGKGFRIARSLLT